MENKKFNIGKLNSNIKLHKLKFKESNTCIPWKKKVSHNNFQAKWSKREKQFVKSKTNREFKVALSKIQIPQDFCLM